MKSSDVVVRSADEADHAAIAAVVGAAFGAQHREDGTRTVELVEALRTDGAMTAELVAEATGEDGPAVVGHAGLTRGWLDARDALVDVLVLSPLSVRPDRQGEGIGTFLLEAARAEAELRRAPALFLEGSPEYYGGRGYVPAEPLGLLRPSLRIPSRAFQVQLLASYEPWMTGAVVYAETFWRLDLVGLRDPLLAELEERFGRPGGVGEDGGMDTETRSYTTGSRRTVLDLTRDVAEYVAGRGDGLLHLFVPHATAGLAILETGAGSDDDLLAALDDLLPPDDRWRHRHGSHGHGRDHVLPALVPPYATVPVVDGRLQLGTWQSLCLVDLNVDNPTREVRFSFLAG